MGSRFLQDPPEFLYKYMPWNEGAKKTISEGTLLWSDPRRWNDPFDSLPYQPLITIEALRGTDEGRELIRKYRAKNRIRGAEWVRHKRVHERWLSNALYENVLMDEYASRGILSLSAAPMNLLMWSHYADHHRGIMLELSPHRDPRVPHGVVSEDNQDEIILWSAENLYSQGVVYCDDRPEFRYPVVDGDEYKNSLYFTKSTHWSYEQEFRSIRLSGPGVFPYAQRDRLISIICGLRMSDEAFRECVDAVYTRNKDIGSSIRVFKAEETTARYAVYAPGHLRLGLKT